MAVYFIGGSPCSGKSTIAQELAERYGLRYFKVDDHLERYMQIGAGEGKTYCTAVGGMTSERIWMRDPSVQCEEELMIYEEIFGYIMQDVATEECPNGVITEGAGYLPALMMRRHVPSDRYISITPTKEFQVFHYSQREWVPHVLAGCSDKAKAFDNWMERDALFAKVVQRQCSEMGYVSLVNNGQEPVEIILDKVVAHFGLK